MDFDTAIRILHIDADMAKNRKDIVRAYRKQMLRSHPDKSSDPCSHEEAQRINEAKETLLSLIDQHVDDEPDQDLTEEQQDAKNIEKVKAWVTEMDFATEEQIVNFNRWYIRTVNLMSQQPGHCATRVCAFQDATREYYNKFYEFRRRKRFTAGRRKRAEGSRVHRKIDSHNEGRCLMRDIVNFVKERLSMSSGSKLSVQVLPRLFQQFRPTASAEEMALFQRHCKRVILQEFPGVQYKRSGQLYCYWGIDAL